MDTGGALFQAAGASGWLSGVLPSPHDSKALRMDDAGLPTVCIGSPIWSGKSVGC